MVVRCAFCAPPPAMVSTPTRGELSVITLEFLFAIPV